MNFNRLSAYMLSGILLISLAYAISGSITTFSNGLSSENLTFTGNQNITRYLDFLKYGYVTNLSIILVEPITTWQNCFQENVTGTDCSTTAGTNGFNDISKWNNPQSAYDNNYSTWGTLSAGGYQEIYYENYTVPDNISSARITSEIGDQNIITVSINSSCVTGKSILQLKAAIGPSGSPSYIYCHNGTSFIQVRAGGTEDKLYEMGVNWTREPAYTRNISIQIGTPDATKEWNSTAGIYNISANITLNTTIVNNILSNGCTCTDCSLPDANTCRIPFTFHSDTAGMLQYSNLNATYSYNFGECNSSLNTTALNISFYDETNQTPIPVDVHIDFDYWLPGLTTKIPYSFTGSGAQNYTFCISPQNTNIYSDYTVTYSATDYSHRIYSTTSEVLTQYKTNKKLYLLSLSSGAYVRFRVSDNFQNSLEGVTVTMNYSIGGINSVVDVQTTDSAGLAIFIGDVGLTYTFTFIKAGYSSYSKAVTVQTGADIYSITLSTGLDTGNSSISEGISYFFFPKISPLNNNTVYNFSFNLTSSHWNITSCSIHLTNINGTLLTSAGGTYTSLRCDAGISYNTGNLTDILAVGYIQESSLYDLNVTYPYKILSTYKGDSSLMVFFDDLKSFGAYNFDDFGRMLLAIFCIIILTALVCDRTGLSDTDLVTGLVMLLVVLFSYVGFFTVGNVTYSDVALSSGFGEHMRKWTVCYLILMFGAGSILWRNNR